MIRKGIITVVGLVVIVFIAYKAHHDTQEQKKQEQVFKTTGEKVTIIKEYIRDSIPQVVFKEKLIKDTEQARRLALSKSYADSLEQALKISLSKLEEVKKINGELKAKVRLKESLTSNQLVYKDKFLELAYDKDSADLDLKYKVALNGVSYKQRSWFLGKKNTLLDIYSDDPRVSINGLQSFRVEQPKKSPFSFGLQIGYGLYSYHRQIKTTPYFGVGITYKIIN